MDVLIVVNISRAILLFLIWEKPVVYFPLVPHEFSYLSPRVTISAFAMPNVISEIAFVHLSIDPCKPSPSILEIILVLPLKDISIASFPDSSTMSLTFDKIAFVTTAVNPLVYTFAVEASIIVFAHINISI